MQFQVLEQEILDMLQSDIMNKKSYHDKLRELDSMIPEITGGSMEVSDMLQNSLATYESRRSQIAQRTLYAIKEHPVAGVCQLVALCREHLRKMLEYQNIGHISDICLNQAGALDVDIFISPGSSSYFHDKEATKAIIKELQQGVLEKYYDIAETKIRDHSILNTEKSNQALYDFLGQIKAYYIRTDTIQDALKDKTDVQVIHRIKFLVKPSDLLSYIPKKLPQITLSAEPGEMNEDERLFIIHEIKEMNSAYLYLNADQRLDTQATKNVIWYAFSNICETLEYHGKVYNTIKEQNQAFREQAGATDQMENQVQQLLQPDTIVEDFKYMIKQIDNITASELRFLLNEVCVYENRTRLTLRLIQNQHLHDGPVMFPDIFQKTFQSATIGTFEQESVKIKASNKSFKRLKELLEKHLPGTLMQNIEVEAYHAWSEPTLVFDTFTVQVNDIADFVKQFDTYDNTEKEVFV